MTNKFPPDTQRQALKDYEGQTITVVAVVSMMEHEKSNMVVVQVENINDGTKLTDHMHSYAPEFFHPGFQKGQVVYITGEVVKYPDSNRYKVQFEQVQSESDYLESYGESFDDLISLAESLKF